MENTLRVPVHQVASEIFEELRSGALCASELSIRLALGSTAIQEGLTHLEARGLISQRDDHVDDPSEARWGLLDRLDTLRQSVG